MIICKCYPCNNVKFNNKQAYFSLLYIFINLDLQIRKLLMGCSNHIAQKSSSSWNPIKQYLKHNPIAQLLKVCSIQQYQKRNQELMDRPDAVINTKIFNQIFPKLQAYSEITKKRIYQMLDFEQQGKVRRKNIVKFKIVMYETDSPQLISNIIYYAYSESQKIQNMKQCKIVMKQQGYQRFMKQNSDKINSILVDTDDLVNTDEPQQKLDKKQQEIQKKEYTLEDFQKIFERYQYDRFYEIFITKKRNQAENQLIKQIKKDQQIFLFDKGQKVYLIQYSWFQNWRIYMYKEHRVDIIYSISQQQQEKQNNKTNHKYTHKYQLNNSQIINYRSTSTLNISKKHKRPQRINNYILLGDGIGSLKQNMVESVHYALANQKIWELLVQAYGGSPYIARIYPQIYALQVFIVQVQLIGFFKAKNQLTPLIASRSDTIKSITKKIKNIEKHYCYYKYIGLQNWTRIRNLESSFGEIAVTSKIFITFVPYSARQSFQKNYNIQCKDDSNMFIKYRIKNYASIINVKIQGAIIKAAVMDVFASSVEVAYRNQQNQLIRKKFQQSKLKSINPSNLKEQKRLNYLAGMNNYENNCYMNSTIQCLIKTPNLKQFLQKFSTIQLKQQQAIIPAMYKICENSLKFDLIDMQEFKRKLQKRLQIFQGNSHQDAQQFLLALLQQISTQSKSHLNFQKKIGLRNQDSIDSINKSSNSKLLKIFSGEGFATTECKQCHNKRQVISQFFTYSLNLPQVTDFQISYNFIPKDKKSGWQVQHCMFTINEQVTANDFIYRVSKYHKISQQNLKCYACANGQLYYDISIKVDRKMKYYETYAMNLVVYEISNSPSAIYLQLDSRFEMYNKKSYKMYDIPLLLQIDQSKTWQQLSISIIQIFANKYNEQLTQVSETGSIHSINVSKKPQTPKNALFIFQFLKKNKDKLNNPIKFRILQKTSMKCYFCHKEPSFSNHTNYGFNYCKGCLPAQNFKLSKSKHLKYHASDVIIVLEWDCPERFKGMDISIDKSVQQARQNFETRKIQLTDIFSKNFSNIQQIQLKCQKSQCDSQSALRREGIKSFPNILIVHLNRFRYKQNGMVKINNYIQYSNQLSLGGNNYELYGCVVHEGTCTRGHYFSYVLFEKHWYCCNDQKVKRAQNNQQINPNAYMLFYKKKGLQANKIYQVI